FPFLKSSLLSNYNKCFLCGPFFCRLEKCGLIVACHKDLSSVLHINQTLKELDLSYNDLGSPGVEDLCKGLKHPKYLSPTCSNQTLVELELKWNRLGDSGVKLLCEGLKCQYSRLQKLVLWACELTADCCGVLSSVLSTRKSLAEVNLNLNELGDSGLRWLCTGLKHPDCKLQKLGCWLVCGAKAGQEHGAQNNWPRGGAGEAIASCGLTDNCGVLSSVLSTSQTLIELSLNLNKLGDSGVKQLCTGLKHPNCKLQKLGLFRCDLTADCCGDLSSALGVNQFLTELDLKWNRQLGDSGVKILCEKLKHPNCRLKKISRESLMLRVIDCSIKNFFKTPNLGCLGHNEKFFTSATASEKSQTDLFQVVDHLKNPDCLIFSSRSQSLLL
uniref:Uncharacterized protein n=1 Tax=Pelusios castaneus TaxID=367368 RepID=A0A8C8S2H6_9SAUR